MTLRRQSDPKNHPQHKQAANLSDTVLWPRVRLRHVYDSSPSMQISQQDASSQLPSCPILWIALPSQCHALACQNHKHLGQMPPGCALGSETAVYDESQVSGFSGSSTPFCKNSHGSFAIWPLS